MGYTVQVFSGLFGFFALYLMWGSLTPDIHLHNHGILVSFKYLFTAGHVLLGKFLSVRNLLGFCGFDSSVLFFLRP